MYITFSNIFSILDNSEIGRYFENFNLESFLHRGTTLATFSIVGKIPVENKMLNISANWLEILFLSNFNIFIGMLLGPTDLFESSEGILFCVSDLLVGLRKKEFWCRLLKEIKEMVVRVIDISFCFFSNCCKIIVKKRQLKFLIGLWWRN